MINNNILFIIFILVAVYLINRDKKEGFNNQKMNSKNAMGNKVIKAIKNDRLSCSCRCDPSKEQKNIGGDPSTWTPKSHQEEQKNIGEDPSTWTPYMEEEEGAPLGEEMRPIGGDPSTWTPYMEEQEMGPIGGDPSTWTPYMEEQEMGPIGGDPSTWTPYMEEQEMGSIGGDPSTWTPYMEEQEMESIGKDSSMEEQEMKSIGGDPKTWAPKCYSISNGNNVDISGYYIGAPTKHKYLSRIDGTMVIRESQEQEGEEESMGFAICEGLNCNENKCKCTNDNVRSHFSSFPEEEELIDVFTKGNKTNDISSVHFSECTETQNKTKICPRNYMIDPSDPNFCTSSVVNPNELGPIILAPNQEQK